jgi:lambda family phage portal protein
MLNKTLTPGQVEILPPGMDVQTLDWSSNSANGLGDLTKVILRSVAAAVGVSYEAISGDLSSTSYSSARFGDQMSRVKTQAKQRWFINTFIDRVYKAWLETQLLTGQIPYPFEKYSKFASPKWTPRSFASVDPIKDGNANSLSLLLGVKSRSDICAESGSDYTEVLHAQIAEEKMRIEAYAAAGIELPPNLPQLIPISVAEEQAETKKQEAGEE